MALTLHSVKLPKSARTRKVRVGRGNASGHGTYSGRGGKGQRARSGGRKGLKILGFKQTLQRIPKVGGFKSHRIRPAEVTLAQLQTTFADGEVVSPERIVKKGLADDVRAGVKILATGTLKKKLTIKGCRVTAGAKAAIESAGGSLWTRSSVN